MRHRVTQLEHDLLQAQAERMQWDLLARDASFPNDQRLRFAVKALLWADREAVLEEQRREYDVVVQELSWPRKLVRDPYTGREAWL